MSGLDAAAVLADGWVPPGWMRCREHCRLILELGPSGPAPQLDFVDGVVRLGRAPEAGAGRRTEADGIGPWVVVRTTQEFVDAWLVDRDTLLGDTLGPHLSLHGQLFLVSLFDGLIGQYKAARGSRRNPVPH